MYTITPPHGVDPYNQKIMNKCKKNIEDLEKKTFLVDNSLLKYHAGNL